MGEVFSTYGDTQFSPQFFQWSLNLRSSDRISFMFVKMRKFVKCSLWFVVRDPVWLPHQHWQITWPPLNKTTLSLYETIVGWYGFIPILYTSPMANGPWLMKPIALKNHCGLVWIESYTTNKPYDSGYQNQLVNRTRCPEVVLLSGSYCITIHWIMQFSTTCWWRII